MKNTAKRWLKSGLSMLLALSLVLGVPSAALAADESTDSHPTDPQVAEGVKDVTGDGKITYVSFGDSVTNGYGMDGYRYADGTNVFGFLREPAASYPVLIQKHLEAQGHTVELKQMAISGFRMDELDYMLNDNYVADSYHNFQFSDWNKSVVRRMLNSSNEEAKADAAALREKYSGVYGSDDNMIANADKIIQSEYREAVKTADLITIDLGTNNFGTFVTNTIQELLGLKEPGRYEINFAQYVDAQTAQSLDAIVSQMALSISGSSDTNSQAYQLTYTLAKCLMYGYLGFTEHYDASLDAIYAMNPKAQVVVIDCYTMITGVDLAGGALGENIDLDQLYDLFIDMANFYTRELSPYASKVTHATLEAAPELFIDYYKDYPDTDYPDNQYLQPTAERLMNEFIMEAMGYDPDYPEQRTAFDNDVLNNIKQLDRYVNNLQATVKTEVIDKQVVPGIKSGVQTAVDQVNTAISAIDLIYTAVEGTATAEENLPTAIEGVAQARQLADVIVQYVSEGDTAEDVNSRLSMGIQFGLVDESLFEDLGMTQDEAAALAAELAADYYAEIDNQVAAGKTEEEAQAIAYDKMVIAIMATQVGDDMAELGFAMNAAYESAISAGKTEEEAQQAGVKAGIAGSLTDANMAALAQFGITDKNNAAELVYQVAKLYAKTYAESNSDKEAVVTCLVTLATQLGIEGITEETAATGYDLYSGVYKTAIDAGKTVAEAKNLTYIAAIQGAGYTTDGTDALATAMYAVYCGNATPAQEQLAYITALVSAGISQDVATAIYTCYATNLDGQFNNENVKTTMIFFITQVMEVNQEKAAELYGSYLTYKNLPTTLSKIAKCKTIYFDALLTAAADGLNLDAVAAKFMNGTLKLDEPVREDYTTEAEYNAAVAAYQSDSALATLYFRFMTQDGVFTHPSEAGQELLYKAAIKAIENLNTAEEDSAIDSTGKVLVLGDNITAAENSYVAGLREKLGSEVTNLSYEGFRINEVRALLDSSYAGDAYTTALFGENKAALSAAYADAVQNSDVVVLNLGAMNMGFLAPQLEKYMQDGSTYSMNFSDIENMNVQNLGTTVDGLLEGFESAFTSNGPSETGTLMLAFETYGYGYTTFADCLDDTVEAIKALNPDADIVLVSTYDLLGGVYFETNGIYLEMGDFIGHALDLMNRYMETYAEMNADVTYVDVSDTENGITEPFNMATTNLTEAFAQAMPTEAGYASMAQKIACALGGHTVDGSVTWTWTGYTAAAASFHCGACGEDVTVDAEISSTSTGATCTEGGTITHTAAVTIGGTPYTDEKTETVEATGHSYGEPDWEWYMDPSASATFTCVNCETAKETVWATISTESKNPTCTTTGYKTHTATVTFQGKTYTDSQTVTTSSDGHIYGEPTWTWAKTEDGYTAQAVIACTKDCKENGYTITGTATVTSEVTKAATCVTEGVTTYTASVTLNGTQYTDTKTDTIPATGVHTYGDDHKCTVCGKQDPAFFGSCSYQVEASLTSGGTYILSLGGTQVGTYTFTQVDGGWAIQNADGAYLALDDEGALVTSSTAFAWTYENGTFSAETESSSDNDWWSNIFGGSFGGFGGWWGSSTETYYLVASGSSVTVSTSNSGATAAFYTAYTSETHTYGQGVVTAPTCTEDGCTTYTCENCGHTYSDSVTAALGHDYDEVVTLPTCTTQGCTTHTCTACGDSYVDNVVEATGHNMVDGVCANCGYTEGTEEPEPPVDPEEDECVYLAEKTLTSGGTYILSLGGTQVGTYTFTQVDGGWAIQAADGTYLALEDEALVSASAPFAWTYENGRFSAETESESSGNDWWSNIFGGSFGGWWGSGSSTETYYLAASGSSVTVSTSTSGASAKFYQEVTGDHAFGDPVASDGSHVYTCGNCGEQYSQVCTDENCQLCHPAVPEATVSVSVNVTSSSSGNNWWGNIFGGWWGSSTTYTATITASAEGTEISSVAYSTDGGSTWTEGTSFTSSSNITSFRIRVIGTNGVTYLFAYDNGTVTQIG